MRDLIMALIMNLGVNPGCTPDVLITLAIAQLYSSDSSAIFKTSSFSLPYSLSDPSVDLLIRRLGSLLRNWPFEKIYSEIIEVDALYPYKLASAYSLEEKYMYTYSLMKALQKKKTTSWLNNLSEEFSRLFSTVTPYDDTLATQIVHSLGIEYKKRDLTEPNTNIQHILSLRKAHGMPYSVLLDIYSVWYINRNTFKGTENPWTKATEMFPDLPSQYSDTHVPELFNLINIYLKSTDPVEFLSVLFETQERYSDLELFYLFQLIYKMTYPRETSKVLIINPPLGMISSFASSNIRGLCSIAITSEARLAIYRHRFPSVSFLDTKEIRNTSFNKIFCFSRDGMFRDSYTSICSICHAHDSGNSVNTIYMLTSDSEFTKTKSIFAYQGSNIALAHILRLPAIHYKTAKGKEKQDDAKVLLRFINTKNCKDYSVQISELIDIEDGMALFSPYKPFLPLDSILSSGKTLKGIYSDAMTVVVNNASDKDTSNKISGVHFFSDDIPFTYSISKDPDHKGYRGTVFFDRGDDADSLRFDIHRPTADEIISEIESIPFSERQNAPYVLSSLKKSILYHTIQDPCLKTIWCILHNQLMHDIDKTYDYQLCKRIFSPEHTSLSNLRAKDHTREEFESAVFTDFNEKWDKVDIKILRQLKHLLNRASEMGFDVNTLSITEICKARSRQNSRRDNSLKCLKKKVLFTKEQLNVIIPSYQNVLSTDLCTSIDYNSFLLDVYSILQTFLSIDPDEWCALDMKDYALIDETRFMGFHIFKAMDENDQIDLFRNTGGKQQLRLIPACDKIMEIINLYFKGLLQLDPHACDDDRPFFQILSDVDSPVLRRLTANEMQELEHIADDRSCRKDYHHVVNLADGTTVDIGNKKGSIFKSNWKYMSKKYGFTDAERYYGLGQKAKKPLDNNYIDSGNPYLLMDFAKKTDRAICDALNHNQIMKPNCRKVVIIRIPPNSTCSIDLNRPEFGLNCTAYITTNQGKGKN